jgi:hypothetical protein
MTNDDDDFAALLDGYLEPPKDLNPRMKGVELRWEEGDLEYGAIHIQYKHNITKKEVEEVLFGVPPEVKAKRHREKPERSVFWGATRHDRWLFVACEDRVENGRRILTPITAFEPAEGEEYWRRS